MTNDSIWLVIPALNEQDTLAPLLDSAKIAGMRSLVVDDGSTDSTLTIAKTKADLVISNEKTLGYSIAIGRGLSELARRNDVLWIVTLDADGQLGLADAAMLVAGAQREAVTLAVGIRKNLPRISERLAAKVLFQQVGIRDPLCGLKVFHIESLRRNLISVGRFVNMELAVRIAISEGRLFQTDIVYHPRTSGNSRFGRLKAEWKIFFALIGVSFVALTLKKNRKL